MAITAKEARDLDSFTAVVKRPFHAHWDYGGGELETDYRAGEKIRCASWRPEGMSDCRCSGHPDMWLSWKDLANCDIVGGYNAVANAKFKVGDKVEDMNGEIWRVVKLHPDLRQIDVDPVSLRSDRWVRADEQKFSLANSRSAINSSRAIVQRALNAMTACNDSGFKISEADALSGKYKEYWIVKTPSAFEPCGFLYFAYEQKPYLHPGSTFVNSVNARTGRVAKNADIQDFARTIYRELDSAWTAVVRCRQVMESCANKIKDGTPRNSLISDAGNLRKMADDLSKLQSDYQ